MVQVRAPTSEIRDDEESRTKRGSKGLSLVLALALAKVTANRALSVQTPLLGDGANRRAVSDNGNGRQEHRSRRGRRGAGGEGNLIGGY
ncbi:hypothetical protein EVAR_14575_1 [Eumeta japonica]|uniref:Uncharacterized protein n=1 Tax=Eumeta variegata TaxID=151549 RepID=A0A4C1UUE4_EUMVA|nr:hypothetical protein EVAR_14575_1 [Eumeta japonica]